MRHSLVGDQIDVFEHHEGGLERSRQSCGRLDVLQRRAAEHDDGVVNQLADQVSRGQRLARSRRTVQQQPPLEMLA
jgi:hypothetical protein